MSRVMVCSTYYDLVDARAELAEVVRALGFDVVLSELSDSDFVVTGDAAANSIEECLGNVRRADVVIFVLSQRYGPPLPGGYAGLSATHVEYNEAKRLNKR